jgi:PIN domain nuclease of toxin-antitoxin system
VSAFVTDTHPLIWYTAGKHSRLSPRVLRIFEAAFADRALIVIPSPVFWEISLLIEHDKIRVREPFASWAGALTSRSGIDMAALGLDVIAEAHRLRFHGDPFDRTIVATARLMDLPLITKDATITDANLVDVYW